MIEPIEDQDDHDDGDRDDRDRSDNYDHQDNQSTLSVTRTTATTIRTTATARRPRGGHKKTIKKLISSKYWRIQEDSQNACVFPWCWRMQDGIQRSTGVTNHYNHSSLLPTLEPRSAILSTTLLGEYTFHVGQISVRLLRGLDRRKVERSLGAVSEACLGKMWAS